MPFVKVSSVLQASALDCTKATRAVDKAICGSESLRKADASLSDLYFAMLLKLEGARHQLRSTASVNG